MHRQTHKGLQGSHLGPALWVSSATFPPPIIPTFPANQLPTWQLSLDVSSGAYTLHLQNQTLDFPPKLIFSLFSLSV